MPLTILDSFITYIRSQSIFSDAEVAVIRAHATPRRLKKKQYLLHPGDVCRFYTFVCSGCLRSYRIGDDGSEHILSFSPEDHWVSDHFSLTTGTASQDFIDALEDSEVIQFSVEAFRNLLRDIPHFEQLYTRMIIDDSTRTRDRIYMMISHQADERYRHFIRLFPQLCHRVPLFMIASYLGVARETLTRIRGSAVNL